MRKYRILTIIIIAVISLAFAGNVFAEEEQPTPSADDVNSIAGNMFCPVCENIPLDVCGTEACAMWREEIADLLTLGYSEDEIYEYFYKRHGDMVLATPPMKGFNWLLYVIPPIGIVVGVIFLVRYLRSTTAKTMAEKPEEKIEKASDEYQQKLEDELKKRN